ncbi:MAG: hypothetical protein P8Y99_07600 [Calditrichaceae bacterium]
METIKPKDCKINSTDSWIIGGTTLLGLCAGFLMPQTSVMAFIACLMIGAGLGLIISSIFSKKQTEKQ